MRPRAPVCIGKGLGFDVGVPLPGERQRHSTYLCLSQLSTFELKKVLTALEFSGSPAVFNSCKEPLRKGGEKNLKKGY